MAFYLIVDNEIAGVIQNPEFFPGREIVEGPDEDLALLYFKDGEVKARSPQPPGTTWDMESEEWVVPPPPPAPPVAPDWDALLSALRESDPWAKVFLAAETTLQANAAWTVLYGTLSRTHHLGDLEWSIVQIRKAMAAIPEMGDFTPEEVAWINTQLEQSGFALRLS